MAEYQTKERSIRSKKSTHAGLNSHYIKLLFGKAFRNSRFGEFIVSLWVVKNDALAIIRARGGNSLDTRIYIKGRCCYETHI